MLAEFGYRAISLDDAGIAERPEESDIECFETFEENASAKARYFAEQNQGQLVLADDSGLCIDTLGGAPGVFSKRWAGSSASGQQLDDANNAKLLTELARCDDPLRGAAYVCVAVIAQSPGDVRWARGETRGMIVREPLGSNGFGYDPYFKSDELGQTFGRAIREEKARVSHRARAVRAVCEQWMVYQRSKRQRGG